MSESNNETETPGPTEAPTPARPILAPENPPSNPYTPGKLFGVAVVGAGCSLFLYYVFQQMEPDQKRRIKGSAFRGVKNQVRGWVIGDDAKEDSEPT